MSSEITYVAPKPTPEELRERRIRALEEERRQNKIREMAQQKAIADLSAQLKAESQRRESDSKQHSREMQEMRRNLSAENQKALEQMAQSHNQQIASMRQSFIESMEKRESYYQQRFQESEERAEETKKQLEQQINATNVRIDSIGTNLQNQIDEMNEALNQSIRHLQGQISQNTADIQNILQREHKNADNAIELLHLAQAMLQQVEESNDLDRFVPEEALDVRAYMKDLASNYTRFGNQALQAAAFVGMKKIEKLQRDCLIEMAKYEALINDTRLNLKEIQSVVNSNRELDNYFKCVSPMNKNDFWSRGKYQEIEKKLGELDNDLNQQPSIEKIKIMRGELDELRLQEARVTSESIELAKASAKRAKKVDDMVKSLMSNGWNLKYENGEECANYCGGEMAYDWRESVFAILVNEQEEEVFIKVEDDNISVRLNDEQMTPERYQVLLGEVNEILGLAPEGTIVPKGTCTSPSHRQIPKLRQITQKGAAQQVIKGQL